MERIEKFLKLIIFSQFFKNFQFQKIMRSFLFFFLKKKAISNIKNSLTILLILKFVCAGIKEGRRGRGRFEDVSVAGNHQNRHQIDDRERQELCLSVLLDHVSVDDSFDSRDVRFLDQSLNVFYSIRRALLQCILDELHDDVIVGPDLGLVSRRVRLLHSRRQDVSDGNCRSDPKGLSQNSSGRHVLLLFQFRKRHSRRQNKRVDETGEANEEVGGRRDGQLKLTVVTDVDAVLKKGWFPRSAVWK